MQFTEEQVCDFVNEFVFENIDLGRSRGYELMCESIDGDMSKASVLSECTDLELAGAILESYTEAE